MANDRDHYRRVMRAFGFGHGGADACDALWWRTEADGTVRLFALCSDFFHWATADCEEITPDDVDLVERCLADLTAIDETWALGFLYAARKRHMRPLPALLNDEAEHPPPLRDLFLACGLERPEDPDG